MHDERGSDRAVVERSGTKLFGRDAAVDHVTQLVRRPDVRLVTITGRSGVGKSALASTVARSVELEDGVGIARTQVDRHAPAVGADELRAALAAPTDGPAGAPPAGRRRVVLLDGLEAVPGASEHVAAALAADEGLTVLTTTVVPLGLPGEQLVRLEPLRVPAPTDPVELQRAAPAVQLLCARIAEATGRAEAVDLSTAVAVCRILDGLPLALELAAARCAERSLAEVHEQVERLSPVEVLHSGVPGDEPHHQSLHATILWSYGLLDGEHRRVLRRLGVFAGSFSRRDACEVAGADPGHLDRLVATGLARAAADPPTGDRFELVSSVSLVARELLDAEGELLAAEDRHASHLLDVAAEAAPALRSPATPEVRRAVMASVEEIVTAVRHLDRRGRRADALRLLVDLALVWEESGPSIVAAALLDELLPADGADRDEPSETVAEAWSLAAMVAVLGGVRLQRHDEVGEQLDRAATAARREGWTTALLTVLRSQVAWRLLAGQPDGAAAAARGGLDVAVETDDPWWRCQFLGWCAASLTMLGDVEGARALAVEGRDLALLRHDPVQLLRLSHLLIGITGFGGDAVDATSADLDLIALARRVGDVHAEGVLRVGSAALAAGQGRIADGATQVLAALELGRRRNLWYIEELAIIATTMLAGLGGRPEDVARLHGGLLEVLPRIELAIAPDMMQHYRDTVELARRSVGDAHFERCVGLGRLLEWEAATALAAAVCADLSAASTPEAAPSDGAQPLSPRQIEVLATMARGRTNKEIAVDLGMRPKTVMHHASEIYRRLGVRNRTEAVAAARRLGLLPSSD